MGSSKSPCFLLFALAAAAQTPAPIVRDASLRPPARLLPEVALASCAESVSFAEFGLGDGGIAPASRGLLQWSGPDCKTAGGVRVQCLAAGVKMTFPSGRELLVAPDGFVHLRSGESAGPFPNGLELWLADGQTVRISLVPSETTRVRDVVVGDAERRLQPWRRGAAAAEIARNTGWAGVRVMCLGDGGDLYRAVALGPLVVLERLLVTEERQAATPEQRLVLLTTPLVQSLRTMQRQHREPDAAVRQAITAVGEIADHGDLLFAAGAQLQRAERDRLRWLLRGGFEVELTLTGQLAPRLMLFAGESPRPLVEWSLRADAAAFLVNPHEDQAEKRWHGNGTRLPKVVNELQARDELFEFGRAMRAIERLKK